MDLVPVYEANPRHGVVAAIPGPPFRLSQPALLFNKIHVLCPGLDSLETAFRNDLEYLQSVGFVELIPAPELLFAGRPENTAEAQQQWIDVNLRRTAAILTDRLKIPTVPVCWNGLPASLPYKEAGCTTHRVLNLTFKVYPLVYKYGPWERVLQHKREIVGNLLGFRQLVNDIMQYRLGERGLNDCFGWWLAMYDRAAGIEKSGPALDVYILGPAEQIDYVMRIDAAKVTDGYVAAKTCSVELLESETKAADRHCAYVLSFPPA